MRFVFNKFFLFFIFVYFLWTLTWFVWCFDCVFRDVFGMKLMQFCEV